MQFHHAHGFRPQVTEALLAEMPDVYDRWLDLGAEPIDLPGPTGAVAMGTRSRRMIFEQALRETAGRRARPRADHRACRRGDGRSGPSGWCRGRRDARPVRRRDRCVRSVRAGHPPARCPTWHSAAPCGIAYVDRMYQLHDRRGCWSADQSARLASRLRRIPSPGLPARTRHRLGGDRSARPSTVTCGSSETTAAFDAACRAIPGLSDWTDPSRARPITPVLPGGNLHNHYLAQTTAYGRLVLPGLYFVGDAVCTTTPTFGRGMATSLLQARELLRLIDTDSDPHRSVTTSTRGANASCDRGSRNTSASTTRSAGAGWGPTSTSRPSSPPT